MSAIDKTSIAYYIELVNAIGVANKNVSKIIYQYKTARNFIESGKAAWVEVGLSSKATSAMERINLQRAETVMAKCDRLGYKIITVDSPEYPDRLKRIPNFPLVLYVNGKLPDIDNEVAIAVVGTRNASNYGAKVAHIISGGLAKAGAIIVSGGALGIDSVAHKAALMNGTKTVAVLGSGLDSNYLSKNKDLRKAISDNGALVSEFEPGTPASKYTFPIRNRIISGLCLGTVIIEAGIKSGSLITAEHALEQGRDVFAAPGSVISPSFEGTNKFLREGAKPVFSAYDVLEEYTSTYPHKINLKAITPLKNDLDEYHRNHNNRAKVKSDEKSVKRPAESIKPKIKKVLVSGVSEGAKITYENLTFEPILFDDLVNLTGLDSSILARSLTELEIFGMITSDSGNKYLLKSD